MSEATRRPQVVAIYCPLWHSYDHASSWKGEGWCEWELVKSAIPRFPGHRQPLPHDEAELTKLKQTLAGLKVADSGA